MQLSMSAFSPIKIWEHLLELTSRRPKAPSSGLHGVFVYNKTNKHSKNGPTQATILASTIQDVGNHNKEFGKPNKAMHLR
jgi:hypothetical protein